VVKNSGLLRRLAAILYDTLLVVALLMLTTTFFLIGRGGEALEPYTLPHQIVSLAVIFMFFVGFWTRKGSTLGMLAWGLRLETPEGDLPPLSNASLRFVVAILSWASVGLGFLWQLWDPEQLTWHDRLSGTRLRHYPKKKKS
jgi:uncharacterized RDD family membrane protein YckC